MEEFILLKNRDMNDVCEFLNNNPIKNSFLIGNIQNYGLESNKLIKKSGYYYGYLSQGNLVGVFLFTNNGNFIPCYEKDDILNKIILLKTIKKHNPKHLSGLKKYVEPIWKMMDRTTRCLKYDECNLMVLEENNFKPSFVENEILNSKEYDFSKTIDFLIEVEKAFGRNPNTINDLKNKVYERFYEGDHLYLLENDKVVSQAMIQNITSQLSEIGGVFTLPQARSKGYGGGIVSELCKKIFKNNKTPYLVVSNKNKGAINLYNSIGFEYFDDYLMIDIEMI